MKRKARFAMLLVAILFLSGCNFQAANDTGMNTCPEGYVSDGTDCVLDHDDNEPLECPVGYIEDANGHCVEDVVEDPDEPISVYFLRPDDWVDCYVYFYDTNQGDPITWGGSIKMTRVYGHVGWYYYEFSDDIEYTRIMFKSSENDQIPPPLSQGLMIDETTWFFSDYSSTVNNPFE